jgi:hypothetical protein
LRADREKFDLVFAQLVIDGRWCHEGFHVSPALLQ